MKKLFALLLLPLLAFAQPTTNIANARISGTNNVVIDAASLKFGSTTPGSITGLNGALTLEAGGTNQNITLTPSGTGNITLGGTTGGVRIPSTNTAGLQLYNTVDQTTNYERLEALYAANVAIIRSTSGGTGTRRALSISGEGITLGASSVSQTIRTGGSTSGTFQFGGIASGQAGAIGYNFSGFNSIAASGTNVGLSLTPTYNQTSGTAANTDLLINRTETAVGSGAQYLIQAQTGSSNRFLVSNTGNGYLSARFGINVVLGAGDPRFSIAGDLSSGAWGVNGILQRYQAATYTDTSTAASGTAASAVFSSFAQPTLAATNSSVTTTDAATVYIANAPATGTNQTITNPWALWVDAGNSRFDGDINYVSGGVMKVSTDTLSGAGAVSITKDTTKLTSTGAAEAITLADGTDGQIKRIIHDVDGGSMVLTPTTKTGWSTATFTNAGDSLTLEFVTTRGWIVMASYGTVVAP